MTTQWLNISGVLDGDLATWPGNPGVLTRLRESIGRGDDANVTQLRIDFPSGTHVDAPRHSIADGDTVEELGLGPFIGPTTYRRPFDPDYATLTLDGAEWLAARDLSLAGIGYLSIQRYSEPFDVHRVLLDGGTPILEGLYLADVTPGPYELACLPIRLVNVEGAPARAILVPQHQ